MCSLLDFSPPTAGPSSSLHSHSVCSHETFPAVRVVCLTKVTNPLTHSLIVILEQVKCFAYSHFMLKCLKKHKCLTHHCLIGFFRQKQFMPTFCRYSHTSIRHCHISVEVYLKSNNETLFKNTES